MHVKRKKLNLNVKREFQMWLLLRIFGTILVSSVIAAIILYFYSRQELRGSFFDAHIKLRRVSDLLLPVIFAGSFVSLFAGTLLAIFLPQKIAGPIFRVEQDLQLVGDGNLTGEIRLRAGDVLHELAETVNDTTANLREIVEEIKKSQSVLETAINENNADDIAAAFAAHKEKVNMLITD
jgi:methyl-accepting chemotaxis protein